MTSYKWKGYKLIVFKKASHCAFRPEQGEMRLQICVFVDQDLWWRRLGRGVVNTVKTSHLRCFVWILQFTLGKKKWGVVHKFSMHFCKPTGLWLFRKTEPTALYYTYLHRVLGLPHPRNCKKGNMSLQLWLDFICHKVWIFISQGTETGRWMIVLLPFHPLLISLVLLNCTRTEKGSPKWVTKDHEKLFILMFRRSLRNIKSIYWNNCGFSLKSCVSKDFPAGYFWSKKICNMCHLTMFVGVF